MSANVSDLGRRPAPPAVGQDGPGGRPSNKPVVRHHEILYQAGTWNKLRRVVAKIKHHKGDLFPRVGFIVTNLRRSARRMVTFYNDRRAAEQ
jgi:hypothetical protein